MEILTHSPFFTLSLPTTPLSSSASAMSTFTSTISLSLEDTSSSSHSYASATRPWFLTCEDFDVEAPELKRVSLALTLLYLALKSLLGLTSGLPKGLILFNSSQMQDFVSIKDFEEINDEMMYNVQEIFFRLHQGLGQDDLSRKFSSLLVIEVDKRNLNPLKQMRVIQQLRQ
ncbi:hypothetical protein Tco_0436252 [Tanacetum coccineum]